MDYAGRLLLCVLCLLRLYVVVFTACPGSPFTDSNGTISSPGFNTPQSYDDNLNCTYRIMVPANRRVILEFKFLDILGIMPDCEGDSLEILVGCSNSSIGKFCSCLNLSMPSKIYSLDNCMTLIFKSDSSMSAKGFKAEYTSIDNITELDPDSNCSSTELLGSSKGTFYTPNWPLTYPPSTTCLWTFRPPEEKTVRLFFMSFEMEKKYECEPNRPAFTGDEIRVKGTNSTGGEEDIIPRICGKPDVLYYTIKQMREVNVSFESNLDEEFSGVIAGYASYEKGTLNSTSPRCQAIPEVPGPTTTTTTTTLPSTTTTTLPSTKPSRKPGNTGFNVVAVVVPIVCIFILAVLLVIGFFCWRRYKSKKELKHGIRQSDLPTEPMIDGDSTNFTKEHKSLKASHL